MPPSPPSSPPVCPICYDTLTPELSTTLRPCAHQLHLHCLAPYLLYSTAPSATVPTEDPARCPYCRTPIGSGTGVSPLHSVLNEDLDLQRAAAFADYDRIMAPHLRVRRLEDNRRFVEAGIVPAASATATAAARVSDVAMAAAERAARLLEAAAAAERAHASRAAERAAWMMSALTLTGDSSGDEDAVIEESRLRRVRREQRFDQNLRGDSGYPGPMRPDMPPRHLQLPPQARTLPLPPQSWAQARPPTFSAGPFGPRVSPFANSPQFTQTPHATPLLPRPPRYLQTEAAMRRLSELRERMEEVSGDGAAGEPDWEAIERRADRNVREEMDAWRRLRRG
ncbi:hypothetical protein EDC01DRAFT_784577 [Geopyxis carbonaria]|nr:hypothetical protein EDC01DRAFT_784577 [Geopyxis carbonaria]